MSSFLPDTTVVRGGHPSNRSLIDAHKGGISVCAENKMGWLDLVGSSDILIGYEFVCITTVGEITELDQNWTVVAQGRRDGNPYHANIRHSNYFVDPLPDTVASGLKKLLNAGKDLNPLYIEYEY